MNLRSALTLGSRNSFGNLTTSALAGLLLSVVSACNAGGGNGQADATGGAGTVPLGSGGGVAVGTGATPGAGAGTAVGGTLPCNIDTLVKARCQTCHGATPIGGAPMSLVTEADFQRDYMPHTTTQLMGQTIKLYQLARIRINGGMGTMKMPQGNPLSPDDFAALDSWLGNGAPPGAACTAPPAGAGGSIGTGSASGTGSLPGSGGSTGIGGTIGSGSTTSVGGGEGSMPGAGGVATTTTNIVTPTDVDTCANDPSQFQPLVAQPGETCYEFPVHGISSPTDTTKFNVPNGQTYNQFYYKVPWPPGTLATRFGAKFDNLSILHHWLAFGITNTSQAVGTVQPGVSGTTLGLGAELIGGWAVGGCNVNFGPDMGLKLPDSGQIMVQWHNYNSTGSTAQDGTIVQFCTVPAGGRPNIGGLTFLGTENLDGPGGMPAHQVSKFSGTCTNNSGKPITIMGYDPHMHLLGTNMNATVKRANGMTETAFDHPFLFDHQVNYMLPRGGYILQPGDSITSTCTFNNTTNASVAFGQPTQAEMCYLFTFAYPYNALNNHVISLIGASNTCW